MQIITRSPVFSVARKQKHGEVFFIFNTFIKLLDATLQAIGTAVSQSEVGTGDILHTNAPSAALEGQTRMLFFVKRQKSQSLSTKNSHEQTIVGAFLSIFHTGGIVI